MHWTLYSYINEYNVILLQVCAELLTCWKQTPGWKLSSCSASLLLHDTELVPAVLMATSICCCCCCCNIHQSLQVQTFEAYSVFFLIILLCASNTLSRKSLQRFRISSAVSLLTSLSCRVNRLLFSSSKSAFDIAQYCHGIYSAVSLYLSNSGCANHASFA